MTCALLLQTHYHEQLVQYKISSLDEKNKITQQYLESVGSQTNQQLQTLVKKIGQLQAQSVHLNNLGERIIDKSNFPRSEFDLDESQEKATDQVIETEQNKNNPIDNPYSLVVPRDLEFSTLHKSVLELQKQYENNKNLLEQLEITFNNLHLIDELFISGRPVSTQGSWISSPFGTRTDPFTGRLRRHKGVDIAGYSGMPIIATAAGIVTTSEAKNGYGYLVEINHGSGFKTRYAHASSILVSVGDVVEKGQQVAVMGTTGRSTGPHVHYEVIKDGQQIDPKYYIYRLAS